MSNDIGPMYGVPLIKTLKLGVGSMMQAMPTRQDLERVTERSTRTASGYEVLLSKYHRLLDACKMLRDDMPNDSLSKKALSNIIDECAPVD